ncbi:MAG: hypothetical protein IPM16_20805 [Chloroflexi bacterium]|nr:hypothetical protein [Chloroflexota bacterium]
MWLILADDTDSSARWLYQQLKHDARLDVRLASAFTVASNINWAFRASPTGSSPEFILADGRRISTDCLDGVLNRLTRIPSVRGTTAPGRAACEGDPEQTAHFVNWMYSLSIPVLNRPDILNLTGIWRRASDWTVMASVAGLLPAPFRAETPPAYHTEVSLVADSRIDGMNRTVFVVGGRVVGEDVPASIADGCVCLSHILNCDLIAAHFCVNRAGAWLITGFSAQPDLRLGGDALVHAIAAMMLARNDVLSASA